MRSDNLKTVNSGTAGLDEILIGGFPASRLYLLEGYPGTGKTSFALKFLLAGVAKHESCLYIALSESRAEVESAAASHGWDLTGIHIFEMPLDRRLDADAQNTFFYSSEMELGETNQAILTEIARVNPVRVVFDSLSELKLLTQEPSKFRRQVIALKEFFIKQGATVLLLDDKTASADLELQSIAHGVLRLEQLAPEYGAERRRLKISKLRGLAYRGGYHDFKIETGGPVVFPRLVAANHASQIQKSETLSSGLAEFDKLMGGGIERGSSTLLIGPAGSGKSTITIQFAVAAALRGEKSSVFVFDESLNSMLKRSKGMGSDLQKFIDSGLITIKTVDPAELSPGEFAALVRDSAQTFGAHLVIFDSLNGYLNAMPEERFLVIQMHELLSYLAQMNVATFLIVGQHGLVGGVMGTAVDISYLADNVIMHRYFEAAGVVLQALSMIKKRSGYHEKTIRELKLTDHGPEVGEPLRNFQGVLSGIPTFLNQPHGE